MFAVIVAVLLGLGVAVAVKASGFLNPAEPKKEPPPPMVLVAAGNIFEGNCLQAGDVRLRPARSGEELEGLKKGDYLPPMPQAAVRRFAKVSIPADAPIKKEFLEDLNAPPDLRNRLSKGMRAVNATIPKEHCDGGMIQVGDWVDVSLSTSVESPDGSKSGPATRSAIIARNVRVIAKRNDLWPKNTPLGPSCPCHFTMELDPYRAALLEFAKQKGTLSLQLIPEADKQRLEARRNEIMSDRDGVVPVSFNLPDSPEYSDEDHRVANFVNGQAPISEQDLMRIFDLKYVPPATQPLPPPPATITKISGTNYAGQHEFQAAGAVPPTSTSFAPPNNPAPLGPNVVASGPGGFVTKEATGKNMAPNSTTPAFNFRPPDSNSSCATSSRRKN
jgi:Flp pilus assembly protein CpaB